MPFSGPGDPKLPDHIKEKAESIRKIWVEVWNKTFSKCQSEGGSDCEGLAFRIANGVIMKNTLIMFNLNQKIGGLVKEVIHTDGIRYLIAPTVAIIEGVMNDTLYIGDEINAYIEAWNGKPLIIDHPTDNDGEFVSANSPELLREVLGFYYNAIYEDNKLKGEWWLDIEKAQKTISGQQVLKDLKAGKILEQSTGLFTDIEDTAGEFNGEHYENIARNIRPDHVAILLHEQGACSVQDGCGTPRINENLSSVTYVSESNIIPELKKIKETLKTYGQTLTDIVNLRGNNNNDLEDNQMSKEELIEWLLSNSPVPLQRAWLEAATDEELAMMAEAVTAVVTVPEPSVLVEEEPEVNDGEIASDFTLSVPVTPDVSPSIPFDADPGPSGLLPKPITEFMSMLTEYGGLGAIKELIQEAQNKQVEEFDTLIELVTANTSYTKDDLENLPVTFLRKMAINITPAIPDPIYANRGMGVNVSGHNSEWTVYGEEIQ